MSLKNLEYISSSGLRVLLTAVKKAREQKGDVRFFGIQPFVKDVFELFGFFRLFKIFDTEEEAVASFQGT